MTASPRVVEPAVEGNPVVASPCAVCFSIFPFLPFEMAKQPGHPYTSLFVIPRAAIVFRFGTVPKLRTALDKENCLLPTPVFRTGVLRRLIGTDMPAGAPGSICRWCSADAIGPRPSLIIAIELELG